MPLFNMILPTTAQTLKPTVLSELKYPGIYDFSIQVGGTYEILLVGGGGGSAHVTGHHQGGGGSGYAALYTFKLVGGSRVSVEVGLGGKSDPDNPTAGGDTRFVSTVGTFTAPGGNPGKKGVAGTGGSGGGSGNNPPGNGGTDGSYGMGEGGNWPGVAGAGAGHYSNLDATVTPGRGGQAVTIGSNVYAGGGGGGWDDSVEPLYVGQGHGWGAGAGYGPGGRNGYVRIKRIG